MHWVYARNSGNSEVRGWDRRIGGLGRRERPIEDTCLLVTTVPLVADTALGEGSPGSSPPGFPPLENGAERGPPLGRGATMPGVKCQGSTPLPPKDPAPARPQERGRHARAQRPPPRRSLCLPRPSTPRALASAPQAQLRRVTRSCVQLRRGQAQAAQTDCEQAEWRQPGPLQAPRGPSPCRATRS